MYGYPGQYGQPPGYSNYPPNATAPPGMGGPLPHNIARPPGMPSSTAFQMPGMTPSGSMPIAPPGMPALGQANMSLPPKPIAIPGKYQPPPNMAHINFAAPIIHLNPTPSNTHNSSAVSSTSGGASSHRPSHDSNRRQGLGIDGSSHNRTRPDILVPPTHEEVCRTLFIGKIPSDMSDVDLEKILRAVGFLRRWTRAFDSQNKPCSFGFAEYEDAESLEAAIEALPGTKVPATRSSVSDQGPGMNPESVGNADSALNLESDAGGVTEPRATLLVQVDDASRKYAQEWRNKRGEPESEAQSRLDKARDNLNAILHSLFHPSVSNAANHDSTGDTIMSDVKSTGTTAMSAGEIVVNIPVVAGEDELADIPPEMRETVVAEIAAFRERSNRRDLERIRREEEMEAADRRSRVAINPHSTSASTAPSGATLNGIPIAPRGAPSGPRALQHSRNASMSFDYDNRPRGSDDDEDDDKDDESADTDASDDELERRRQEKKDQDDEKAYLDYERRWFNREKARAAALERERVREGDEEGHRSKRAQTAAQHFEDFDDDSEYTQRNEEYFRDKSAWLRSRALFRAREKEFDERDRAMEQREKDEKEREEQRTRQIADNFLDRHAEELSARAASKQQDQHQEEQKQHQRVKISLGAAVAAQRGQAGTSKRTVAEVEGLLEDEEESETTTKRTLIPISEAAAAAAAGMTEEERQQAVRQLAADIPTDKEGLWSWDLQWDYLDETIMRVQIRPFVRNRILEYLGIQEDEILALVEQYVQNRQKPEELIAELEGPLDDETAEVFVKKLWRVLIFCSESEKRGLSG